MKPQDPGMPEPSRQVPQDNRPRYVMPAHGYSYPPAAAPRGGLSAPPALSAAPDAFTLLKALKRRWPVALLLGLIVAAGTGIGAWFLLTPKFTVFSQLHVSSLRRNPLEPRNQGYDRNEFPAYVRRQAERLRGRDVISRAIKQEEVKRLPLISQLHQPIPWIEQELKVDFKEGSEFITVSMRGEDEQALVTFINALVQSYWQEYNRSERKEMGESVATLEKNLNEGKQKLSNLHDRLKQRSEGVGQMASPSGVKLAHTLLLSEFTNKRAKLEEAETLILQREAFLKSLKKQEASPAQDVPEIDLVRAIEEDPQVKQLHADVIKLERDLQQLQSSGVRRTEPSYGRKEDNLAAARNSLEEARAALRPKLVEAARLRQQALIQSQIQLLQSELEMLADQRRSLRESVAALEQKVIGMDKEAERVIRYEGDIEQLKGEIKNAQLHVDNLSARLDAARMELDLGPRVGIHQEAAVQYKDNKRQILAAAAAAMAGLIGVAFCVAWWEFRARRIQTSAEVATNLGMRVVGSVPTLPQFAVLTNNAELDAHGQNLQESIDGIRTMLLRDANVEGTRVVMVTSAVDGEGKTMLASYLAQSLARAGRRTLLVDCDLRRPAAHQLFEQTLQPGFSEVLLREVDESDAIRPTTAAEGLFLFPAGQYDREVIQALAKDGLERIFERMRDEYDFVVVDSHPVLSATDSLLIGQYVDAVILSVLRDVSQMPRVHAAHQRLTNLGIRVLGSVVTGVPDEEVYGGSVQYTLAQR